MTANGVLLALTVLGSLVAVATFIQTERGRARAATAAEQAAREAIRVAAFEAGVHSRDDEVRQLTVQVADRDRDLDRAQRRGDEFEARYLNLLNRPGGA